MFATRAIPRPLGPVSAPGTTRRLGASRGSTPRAQGCRVNVVARANSSSDDDARRSTWTPAALLAALPAALSASVARAVEAIDDVPTMYVPPDYVPSPLDDGDGAAQFIVLMVCAVCGFVGMKLSLDSEQVKSEEALAEKVNKQVAAMRTAPSGPVKGVSASDIDASTAVLAKTFDDQGLLRLDGVISSETAAALLAEVNATLDRELARAGTGGLPSESFGNVYCKGNRYDLKLPLSGVASAALKEATASMRPFLSAAAGGEGARLCEFAALVSDPGSARQPVHPDTNYRRDRCVVTSFVALQDVSESMGPTVFIPGSHTASAHLAFREAGEVGGPALAAPHGVATLSTGDATVFDSRLLHCGGGNASEKRRVLFYFSFEVAGSDNPNSAVSTIREELRGKYTLADLR